MQGSSTQQPQRFDGHKPSSMTPRNQMSEFAAMRQGMGSLNQSKQSYQGQFTPHSQGVAGGYARRNS